MPQNYYLVKRLKLKYNNQFILYFKRTSITFNNKQSLTFSQVANLKNNRLLLFIKEKTLNLRILKFSLLTSA